MSETIGFLMGPLSAVVASVIFLVMARRETNTSAALVNKINADFHCQIEEQIRRLQHAWTGPSKLALSADVKKSVAAKAHSTAVGT